MNKITITFTGRRIFSDEAEVIEDKLVQTLYKMGLDASVYSQITGNTTTTLSYADRMLEEHESGE